MQKKKIKRLTVIALGLLVTCIVLVIGLSRHIKDTTHTLLFSSIDEVPSCYTGIVLGASVHSDGQLSTVLRDRVETAYQLYATGKVKRLLLSGDNGSKNYNEPSAMKRYLIKKGVPAEHIFLDYAGFDTYDSVYRAQAIFQVRSAIIVTQDFHLPRALYIAQRLGLNYYGLTSDLHRYGHENSNKNRELLANVKAYIELAYHKEPTYLGPQVPIYGPPQKP